MFRTFWDACRRTALGLTVHVWQNMRNSALGALQWSGATGCWICFIVQLFKNVPSPRRCEPKPGWRHEEEIPLNNNSTGDRQTSHPRLLATTTNGLFGLIDWRDAVWRGEGVLLPRLLLKKKQTKRGHKRVYLRYESQWFNLTVFSNKPGMRTRRREWRGHLFLFCLFFSSSLSTCLHMTDLDHCGMSVSEVMVQMRVVVHYII